MCWERAARSWLPGAVASHQGPVNIHIVDFLQRAHTQGKFLPLKVRRHLECSPVPARPGGETLGIHPAVFDLRPLRVIEVRALPTPDCLRSWTRHGPLIEITASLPCSSAEALRSHRNAAAHREQQRKYNRPLHAVTSLRCAVQMPHLHRVHRISCRAKIGTNSFGIACRGRSAAVSAWPQLYLNLGP